MLREALEFMHEVGEPVPEEWWPLARLPGPPMVGAPDRGRTILGRRQPH